MRILVYVDEGAGPLSVRLLLKALKSEGIASRFPLKTVRSKILAESNWEPSTALLIFPGGRDIYYHQLLQGPVNARIRNYVEQGGSYLGICAGGYYGCASLEFEKGYPLEVIAERELRFFPGLARGPAYGPNRFRYEDESGSCVAELTWNGRENLGHSSLYFNGGCFFVDPHLHPNIEVLARYNNLPETPAAIVECAVGKGRAILSGVHPEHSASYLEKLKLSTQAQIDQLKQAEPARQKLFQAIIQRLLLVS